LSYEPENLLLLGHCEAVMGLMRRFPFKVDMGKAQNRYYRIMENVYAEFVKRAESGEDEECRKWVALFRSLGEKLRVKVRAGGGAQGNART
jgi:hypothetical protein